MIKPIAFFAVFFLLFTGLGCGVSEREPAGVWRPAIEPQWVDQGANVFIPADEHLVRGLRVAVVYNDSHIQVRYEFETDHPSWYHDYLVYRDGSWQRLGRGEAGPASTGLQEDRIAMMLDDGSVDGFDEYGGYVTMHPGVSGRTDASPEDVNKFLPASREGSMDARMWQRRRSAEELDRLRDEGRFINTWQWRAHRSHPIGYADPGYVLDARQSAEGRGMYATNWDGENNRPLFMFDPARAGGYALRKEALLARQYGQDDPYFLTEDGALAFDADRQWREGDVLPRRYLREPSGSRASLQAEGRWVDGAWRVQVTRQLPAPNPRDSKAVEPGRAYNVAFAVHAEATQSRWHYVSMPLRLGLGVEADVPARYTSGDLSEAVSEWVDVPLFYSGQVYLAWLADGGHVVHRAFARAQQKPLDESVIRELAKLLAIHEIEWLREMGVRPSSE